MRNEPDWYTTHPGRLGLLERFAFVAAGLRERLSTRSSGAPPVEASALASLPEPRGSAARHADQLAAAVLPPWLMAHSSRTYAWAALLGARDGIRFDPELLYAASMLHDLGLTEPYAPPPDGCFAVSGGRAARRELADRGVEPRVAAAIGEAIALHLEIRVDLARGAEAHLLNRGAALDVIGREVKAVQRSVRDEVVARWPRRGCKDHLCAAIGAEARRSPASRVGVLVRLGFLPLIRAAPFDG